MLRYVALCYVTLRYVTLRYVMLRYVTLRYVSTCYTITTFYARQHVVLSACWLTAVSDGRLNDAHARI